MRVKPPLVARHGKRREPIADKSMELDGRVCAVHDVHVQDTRRSAWRERADSTQPDPERCDWNVSGDRFRNGGAARFVDFADEHEGEMHLLRPDEPQPSALAATGLRHALLLGPYRGSRGICEGDCGKKPQADPGI